MTAAKIAVIYYSTWGHIKVLAGEIAKSAQEAGATVDIFQFPEIVPEAVLTQMHAAPKANHPIIAVDDLAKYDGFLFGIPTRFGRAPASVDAFFDSTGLLWRQRALDQKFAGIFSCTGGQHGGQETTAFTTIPYFAHQGIIFVPLGYSTPEIQSMDEISGGSPWGASSISGPMGSRQVTKAELAIAAVQGKRFAYTVTTFVKGKSV